jgi:hypothetical protein
MEAATAQRLDGVRFEFRVASSALLTRDRSAKEDADGPFYLSYDTGALGVVAQLFPQLRIE